MSRNYTSVDAQAKADAAWLVAVRLQQFTYTAISYEVSTSVPHATHIVRGWEAGGLVRRIATPKHGKASKITFEVVPDGEITSPVIGDAYEQMWTMMRKTGGFSPVDLVSVCTAAISVEDAASYCRFLLSAGYLKVVQKALPPNKPAIYRLINKTGIYAPRLRRLACVVDANLGTAIPLSEVAQ